MPSHNLLAAQGIATITINILLWIFPSRAYFCPIQIRIKPISSNVSWKLDSSKRKSSKIFDCNKLLPPALLRERDDGDIIKRYWGDIFRKTTKEVAE